VKIKIYRNYILIAISFLSVNWSCILAEGRRWSDKDNVHMIYKRLEKIT